MTSPPLLEDILRDLCPTVLAVTGATTFGAAARHHHEPHLIVQGTLYPPPATKPVKRSLNDYSCNPVRVYLNNDILISNAVQNDPLLKYKTIKYGVYNLLAIPLVYRGSPSGVICVANKPSPNSFSAFDAATLTKFMQDQLNRVETPQEVVVTEAEANSTTTVLEESLTLTSELLLRYEAVPNLAENIGKVIGNPVIILDEYYRPLSTYHSDTFKGDPDHLLAQVAALLHSHIRIYGDGEPLHVVKMHLQSDSSSLPAVAVTFQTSRAISRGHGATHRQENIGVILVLETRHKLADLEIDFLKHAILVYAASVLAERRLSRFVEPFTKQAMLLHLLSAPTPKMDANYLMLWGLSLDKLHTVAAVMVENLNTKTSYPSSKAITTFHQLSTHLTAIYPELHITCDYCIDKSNYAAPALAIVAPHIKESSTTNFFNTLWQGICNHLSHQQVYVGIGGQALKAEEYPLMWQQALETAHFLYQNHTPGVMAFTDLQEAGLFLSVNKSAPNRVELFLQNALGPLFGSNKHPWAMETIQAYIKNDGHLQRTAEYLHIHISTLRYRLGKLEELLNVSLNDADTKFRLRLALGLLEAR